MPCEILQIVGAILIAGDISFSSGHRLIQAVCSGSGDVEAKVSQEHVISPWLGGASRGEVVLIVAGVRSPVAEK